MRTQDALRNKVSKWILLHPEVLTLDLWEENPSSWRKTVLVGLLMEWLGECLIPTQIRTDGSAEAGSPLVLARSLERFIQRYPGPFMMGLPQSETAIKSRMRLLALLLDQLARTYPELPDLVQTLWGAPQSQPRTQVSDSEFLNFLQAHPELLEVQEQDEENIRRLMQKAD